MGAQDALMASLTSATVGGLLTLVRRWRASVNDIRSAGADVQVDPAFTAKLDLLAIELKELRSEVDGGEQRQQRAGSRERRAKAGPDGTSEVTDKAPYAVNLLSEEPSEVFTADNVGKLKVSRRAPTTSSDLLRAAFDRGESFNVADAERRLRELGMRKTPNALSTALSRGVVHGTFRRVGRGKYAVVKPLTFKQVGLRDLRKVDHLSKGKERLQLTSAPK